MRAETIHTVSKTGGHLGSSLGVVELTVALHHVFNCPEDKFLWDVGHQVCGSSSHFQYRAIAFCLFSNEGNACSCLVFCMHVSILCISVAN